MNKICFTALLLLVSQAAADFNYRLEKLEEQMKQIASTTPAATEGAQLPAAWAPPKGAGAITFFDLLFWHPKVEGTNFAYSSASALPSLPVQGQLKDIPFEWNWGFRAGVGVEFDHDKWEGTLQYTYFTEGASTKAEAGFLNILVPVNVFSGILGGSSGVSDSYGAPLLNTGLYCERASSQFKLSYQALDARLSRSFFVSPELCFDAGFGAKAAWIELYQVSQYSGGFNPSAAYSLSVNTLQSKNRSQFTGLGPSFALNSQWYFWRGFSFFGEGSFALLFSRFKLSHYETFSAVLADSIELKKTLHCLSPTAQLGLGLRYDTFLEERRYHLSLSLGYEAEYWWEMNRNIQFTSFNSVSTDQNSNMSLYGVTLRALFEF